MLDLPSLSPTSDPSFSIFLFYSVVSSLLFRFPFSLIADGGVLVLYLIALCPCRGHLCRGDKRATRREVVQELGWDQIE